MGTQDLLIVAGEASGDLHGARVLDEILRLDPEVRAFGMGGDLLRGAGQETLAHASEISVVGFVEVFKILPRAREIFREILAAVDRRKPKVAVLIDSPGFNLRLAAALHKRGVQVVYYISPQVWAWRRGRVKTIAKVIKKMLVVLPFEAAFYQPYGVNAVYVGHPLIDEVPPLPHVWDEPSGQQGPFRLALLPGSRAKEVERLLPAMLEAAAQIAATLPIHLTLVRAPTITQEQVAPILEASGLQIEVVADDRFRAIAGAHLALCASGTATLEVGLVGTPMLVLYRMNSATFALARLLAHSKYASLVNLLLDRDVVPELLQGRAEAGSIQREAVALLGDPPRIREMRAALQELRGKLGEPGAARRAAAEVMEVIRG